MKKTLFLAAVAALFTFASCQKEASDKDHKGELVFTATIKQGTKTTVNAESGVVAWVLEDEVTITDAASTAAKYTVSNIDAKGKATFTKVDGQPTLGDGPYTAVYGSAPATEQTYSADAPSLPMSAESTTTDLTFTVSCGLLEISLTAGESITGIEVTGTPTGGSETKYTLTCSPSVSISGSAKFFVAVPAGTYTSFLLKGENGARCKKEKSGESISVAANNIYPVTLENLHFAVQLWEDGPYWATTNIGAFYPTDYGHYFAWGYTDACVRNSDNNGWVLASDGTTEKQFSTTYYPHKSDFTDAAKESWGTDWSSPTDTDFSNLINSSNTEVENVTEGIKGLRIKGKTGTDYEGRSIFLPAAGSGSSGNTFQTGNHCIYWSSVEYSGDYGKFLTTYPSSLSINKYAKHYGTPVRPIRPSL